MVGNKLIAVKEGHGQVAVLVLACETMMDQCGVL